MITKFLLLFCALGLGWFVRNMAPKHLTVEQKRLAKNLSNQSTQLDIFGRKITQKQVGQIVGLCDPVPVPRSRSAVQRANVSTSAPKGRRGPAPRFKWTEAVLRRKAEQMRNQPGVTSGFLKNHLKEIRRKRIASGRGTVGDIPSARTIRRTMLSMGYKSFGSTFYMHTLTDKQKRARVDFAKFALGRKRKRFPKIMLHADEKIFTLRDTPDNVKIQNAAASKNNYRKSAKSKNGRVYALSEQRCESKNNLKQVCNLHQVLAGVQTRGRSTVPVALWHHPSDSRFNSANFVNGISIWARKFRLKNPSFRRRQLNILVDGATFHAKTSPAVLKKKYNVKVNLLPPYSPDFSILDACLWQGVLKKQLKAEARVDYARKQLQKADESKRAWKRRLLKQAVSKLYKASRQITKKQVKKYEKNFTRVCKLVIAAKGDYVCRKT